MEYAKIEKFLIKNPQWAFVSAIVLTVLSGFLCIVLSVMFCLKIIDKVMFIAILSMCVFLALIGLFCIYGCKKEKFIFENETFTYIKVFKKTQSAKLEDIEKVEIDYSLLIKVRMFDSQGKILLGFLDDGTAFADGNFVKVLKQRNVKVKESGKNWLAYRLS